MIIKFMKESEIEILQELGCEHVDDGIKCSVPYIYWSKKKFKGRAVTLDGDFEIAELEALLKWIQERR